MPAILSDNHHSMGRFVCQQNPCSPHGLFQRARPLRLLNLAWVLIVSWIVCPPAANGDWPMFRADAERSARSDQPLASKLETRWIYRASQPPRPAWPRSSRMPFDWALPVVVADDRVVFGHSATGQVLCLDASTGDIAWQRYTAGPVRFAPAIWRDQVFVASDDGYLYALSLADGSLRWKRQGGPSDDQVLGNQAMISKWPARGGPLVVEDIVYFAAGIWPSEGIYVYALDAQTGETIWCNEDSGAIYMPQPHSTANATSGISAQGHLLASGSHLLVPTGRAVPALLDRNSGQLEHFHLQKYGQYGETSAMATDGMFLNSGVVFDVESGHALAKLGSGQVARTENGMLRAHGTALTCYVWDSQPRVDRKGEATEVRLPRARWTMKNVPPATTLATAGPQAVLGTDRQICLIDLEQQKITQTLSTDGTAHGLAIANGQLLASTDTGCIYCFGPATSQQLETATASTTGGSTTVATAQPAAAAAAGEILQRSGIHRGYCLDLGCGDGQLSLALALASELKIVAVDADPQNVSQVRELMQKAGLNGSRVTVHCRDESQTSFPQYFADLIVSGRSITAGSTNFPTAEAQRLQRPYGGMICLGAADAMQVSRRGALDGAGSWTHQYADPANTVCSGDQLVKGQLGMLWFRDIDFDVPSRHGRAPSPLFHQGRLFHEGINGIVAVNAYNGTELWRYEIPHVLAAYDGDELMGTAGTGSNFCVSDQSVFVRDGDRCLELDVEDGQLRREYLAPRHGSQTRHPWGYVAWSNGLLFGSLANPEHVVTYRYLDTSGDMSRLLTESHSLFAFDSKTGVKRWQYDARDSIRHNTIAISDGTIVCIDRPLAKFDRKKKPEQKAHPTGRLVALDARSGKLRWQNEEEIFGTMLAIQAEYDVVLMSYQPSRFRLDSELGGRLAAFRLSTGQRLWDIQAKYTSRPMINDRVIYAQGGAWDLLTGESVPFDFQRSYGCGILASSKHMLLFRSATLGYYDLSGARKTVDYGGIRPGCWINALPAGGIVLLPDATAGCECSYLNKAWIGLEPQPTAPH